MRRTGKNAAGMKNREQQETSIFLKSGGTKTRCSSDRHVYRRGVYCWRAHNCSIGLLAGDFTQSYDSLLVHTKGLCWSGTHSFARAQVTLAQGPHLGTDNRFTKLMSSERPVSRCGRLAVSFVEDDNITGKNKSERRSNVRVQFCHVGWDANHLRFR